jgi:hypothetical protein
MLFSSANWVQRHAAADCPVALRGRRGVTLNSNRRKKRCIDHTLMTYFLLFNAYFIASKAPP